MFHTRRKVVLTHSSRQDPARVDKALADIGGKFVRELDGQDAGEGWDGWLQGPDFTFHLAVERVLVAKIDWTAVENLGEPKAP